MTPVTLTAPASVTLTLTDSQTVKFWPTDGNGTVIRTATGSSGVPAVRQYGPGMFRHGTTPFAGTFRLDVTQGAITYQTFGTDPA